MRRFGSIVSTLLSVSVLASAGGVASATILPPGGSFAPMGTTSAASPWLAQGTTAFATIIPFDVLDGSGQSLLSGQVFVLFVPLPPFLDRGYTVYVVDPLVFAQATRDVRRVELAGFAGTFVDVGYRTDLPILAGQTVAPSLASRSVDGDVIGFDFASGPSVFAHSESLYIYSTSLQLQDTGTMRLTINTGESVTLTGLPVPVPAPGPTCEGDSNGDGVINFADLNGVLTNFGQDCP